MPVLNNEQLSQFETFLKTEYGSIDCDGEANNKYLAMTAFEKNVLLSAGAGCGKTTTLSLRVAYQILIKDISVSDMLILTFTNNAAREMKDRIKDDLISFATRKDKYPFIDDKAAEVLMDEADKVDTAQISTFDSFSNSIVRKYADELNISPSFGILDDSVSGFIFSKEENSLINSEFLDPNSKIKEFFDRNLSTNNTSLKAMIDALEKIRTKEDNPELLFSNWESLYLTEERQNRYLKECLAYYCKKIIDLSETIECFRNDYCDVYAADQKEDEEPNFFQKASEKLREISNSYLISIEEEGSSHTDMYETIQNFKNELQSISFKGKKGIDGILRPNNNRWFSQQVLEKCTTGTDDKQIELISNQKESITGTFKSVIDTLNQILPTDVTLKLLKEDAQHINYAIELDRRIHGEVERKKRENNSYSFSDIGSMCLTLLEEKEDIRMEEKNRIKSIMVDEYQDSNMLQEKLLVLLGTSEENLKKAKKEEERTHISFLKFFEYLYDRKITFMVGDVKQSIYGFRDARPTLFMEKYDNPKKHNFELLTMRDNYRSTKMVVGEVNKIFEKNMTTTIGGVDYQGDRNQQIKSSNSNLNKLEYKDIPDISSFEYDFDDEKIPQEKKLKNKTLRKRAAALDIAKKIKKWVEEDKLSVYSKRSDEKPRPATYADFAILVRAKSEAQPYIDAFASMNMPCVMDFNQDFKQTSVVMVLENLVKLQYYLTLMRRGESLTEAQKDSYKHCIASIERSFLMDVKDIQIVKDMENAFANDADLKPLVIKKLESINDAADIDARSPNQIVREIFDVFQVYYHISSLSDPDDIMASYNFFMQEIDSLSMMGFTYLDFVEFFTSLREGDLASAKQESKLYRSKDNSIQITTIHKSKGLEYPFVILPMSSAGPKTDKSNGFIDYDPDYGFIPAITKADREFIYKIHPTNEKGENWNPDVKDQFNMFTSQALALSLKREQEALSEHLRILYVALTRARLANIMVFTNPIKSKRKLYESTRIRTKSFEDFGAKSYGSFYVNNGEVMDFTIKQLVNTNNVIHLSYDKDDTAKALERFKINVHPALDTDILFKPKQQLARASKADTIKASKNNERFGTKLHLELECLDWSKYPSLPDTSFIEDSKERRLIDGFVNSFFIESLKGKNPSFYQELGFVDPDSGHEGSMDLAIKTDEMSYVIDYKTSSTIDPAYKRQVSIYRKNLARLFDIDPIRIECYLYSIIKNEFVKVELDDEI